MSMLSAMCERLRNIADNLSANGYTDTVRELRDAADTIDYLRCTCNDLQVDNDKLRHENETLRADAVHWKLEHCPACPNVADLQEAISERERLRELVKNMYGWLVVNYEKSYVIPLNGLNDIERDMRELGIEVEP